MTDSFAFLVITFIIILGFEAVNGWTDAPNAIATVVSTRVLSPVAAVAMAAVFNLTGALSGTAVATTIGKGIIDLDVVPLEVLAAGALAVIIWSTTAAYFGLPTSESHGIVAGLAGAAVAVAGTDVLLWDGWRKVFQGVGLAVVIAFGGGLILMSVLRWVVQRLSPSAMRRVFGPLQMASAAFMAWSHGTADGQKAIGVMAAALAIYEGEGTKGFEVPLWVILLAASVMAASTALGGWRIMRTLGMRLTHLEPVHGFAAEATAAATLAVTSRFGIPLSTTHTIGSAIMGVGASKRLSAVRWGIGYNIVGAWILTFPICFGLGWLIAWLIAWPIP
ncbi:MAG: inorganic phosphate transporter [Chloroflexota bacterium]|nr:inorganic phosphate transporter [Chloroflexota bacterium]